jgi:hypothetical protein
MLLMPPFFQMLHDGFFYLELAILAIVLLVVIGQAFWNAWLKRQRPIVVESPWTITYSKAPPSGNEGPNGDNLRVN